MNHKARWIFAAVFVTFLVGCMYMINNFSADLVTLSSIPVVICAEALVLGMLYATIYHGVDQEHHATESVSEKDIFETSTQTSIHEKRAA